METLNLMSKSNRFYHELTRAYDLKALDAITLNYLINAFKKSVSHGEHGSKGKCFYRHDKKITGFYWSTTLAKLKNDLPCHVGTTKTLESSLGRLQNRYGFIYKHQTIKTKNNGIQIFIPLLDLAVRITTGDYSYQTIINCKDGRNVKNYMIDMLKTNISFYQKLLCRYSKNYKDNNHHVINHHSSNHHINNSTYKTKNNNNPKLIKWISNYAYPKNVNDLLINNCSSLQEAYNNAKLISHIKVSINESKHISRKNPLYKNETNNYIQKGGLLNSITNAFNSGKDISEVVNDDYEVYVKNHKPTHKNNYHHKPHKQSVPNDLKGDPSKLAPGQKLNPTDPNFEAKVQNDLKRLNKKPSNPTDKKPNKNTKPTTKNGTNGKNNGNHKQRLAKKQQKFIKNHKKEYEIMKPKVIKQLKSDQDDLPFDDGHKKDELDDDYKAQIIPGTIKAIKKHHKKIAKERQEKIDEKREAREQKETDRNYRMTIKEYGAKDTVPSNDSDDDLPF